MFKNYFKIALRNLWKNKGFSAINIAGLALGMSCSLLILLWVRDEKNVDAFFANGNRLYRVYEREYFDGKVMGQYDTPGLLATELKKEIPEVELATAYGWSNTHTFSVGDKSIKEKGNAADSDFFRMFGYPLLEGTPEDALKQPESIAISRKMAVHFFGSPVSAMGKTIRYEDKKDFRVTAVFEDLPAQASEPFDFQINWKAFLDDNDWLRKWDNNAPSTYVLLRPGANAAQVDRKITHFLDKYFTDKINGFRQELALQRYGDTYLHGHFTEGRIDGGRIEYVRLFSLVAVFILLIACINFMNLTTARSVKRAKEIGVRKVLGAVRGLLIRQFIGEAVTIAVISAIIALLLVSQVLPAFNQLTGKQIILPYGHWTFWILLAGLTLVTGVLSGTYPAFVLSSFNPTRVLKGGALKAGPGALWFRKGLVVFQFVLSIVLIISTILISRQVRYVQDANLGYDRENLLYIPIEGALLTRTDIFTMKALHLPGIEAISQVSESPTELSNGTIGVNWPGKNPNARPMFTNLAAGYDFIKTMKLDLAGGRDFSKDFPTDSNGFILNEAAVAKIGYGNPIGKPLTFWGSEGTIIGVVKNFHFQSLHDAIKPIIIRLRNPGNGGLFLVRVRAGQTRPALAGLEELYKDLNPAFPFTYQFSSEEYSKLYKSEQVVGRLSVIFACLAIFISCLGLLGLSIFTAVQRTKEIGIRKVLGASMVSLFRLLSMEFFILVGIAFVIAVPLAWWAMHQWLQQFYYRTDISWRVFGLSGALAVLIAFETVCFQTIKAVYANPVKSLRSE